MSKNMDFKSVINQFLLVKNNLSLNAFLFINMMNALKHTHTHTKQPIECS